MKAAAPESVELGVSVEIPEIDKMLKTLWQAGEARTMASLMNLVVYTEEAGGLQRNSVLVQELTRKLACRAILVEVGPEGEEPSTQAWVTAHCHLAGGRKSVCCEQVAFLLLGRVKGRFQNTVFGHLLSDLPVVFWWQGDLTGKLKARLARVIDRLIVDSKGWERPVEGFRQLMKMQGENGDLILHDHEWTRTWQFRIGVASVFDDPCAQRMIGEIERVELRYREGHGHAALHLVAWLAVQAKWRDVAVGGGMMEFEAEGGKRVRVELKSESEGPVMKRLEMQAGAALMVVEQKERGGMVERVFEVEGYRISSMAPSDPEEAEKLVALQLERGGKNSLFQKVLPRFVGLLETLEESKAHGDQGI